jgi:hypothetical protein
MDAIRRVIADVHADARLLVRVPLRNAAVVALVSVAGLKASNDRNA